MDKPFSGKVVLVTGAGRGAGRGVALAFAAAGAVLALNDVSPLNVEETAIEITARGGMAQVFVHDIAKKVAVQALVNQVIDAFGRIDILVNCANVEPRAALMDMDEWDLHRAFEVNAIGTFLMMQSVARVMRARGGGTIVNVVNLAGRQVLPDRSAYVASRAAVTALTRYAAHELAAYHIRLGAVQVSVDAAAITDEELARAVLSFCADEATMPGTIFSLGGPDGVQ
jgi:NAD(P)-dependent dehydrogenase (short-subunit alcohol dehydrogenase family)